MEPQCRRFASFILCTRFSRKFCTACFDMKDDRSKRSGLICVRWNALLEVASDLGANSYSKKKSFTWFPTSRDRVESTALLRDMKKKGQGRGRRQRFLVALSKKGMQATMESPGYLLVTTTTLTRRLAYLRQTMVMLHVCTQVFQFCWIWEVRG